MPRLQPRPRNELADFEPLLAGAERAMGFVPNSMLTMGHRPELLRGFATLAGAVLGPGTVDGGLKQLIAYVGSRVTGCAYCQAHTAHSAEHRGVSDERIAAACDFENSPLFTDAERTALRVAAHAAEVPNAVTDADMAALNVHFSPPQVVEIVGVIALFGFLNRWNDTLATTLEGPASQFAGDHLAAFGWQLGKHG